MQRFAWFSVSALFLGFASGTPAQAAPPTTTDFTIRYFRIDPDGDRVQLTNNDLGRYINKARCLCGEEIEIVLQRRGTPDWDAAWFELQVGRRCDEGAQSGVTGVGAIRPCLVALSADNPAALFQQNEQRLRIPLYWFASGVADINVDELGSTPAPTPYRVCQEDSGVSGIWMCSGRENCQDGTFFMEPQESTMDDTGAGGSTSQTSPVIDLIPPSDIGLDIPNTAAGDGAMLLSWELPTNNAVSGFRVLCRPKDAAADSGWIHPAAETALARYPGNHQRMSEGTIYLLPEQLGRTCAPLPEGSTEADETTDDDTSTELDTGTDTTARAEFQDTSTSGTDSSDSSGTDSESSTGTSTTSSSTGDATDSSSSTDDTTDSTATDTTDETTDSEYPVDNELASLDWKYICSGHLAPSSSQARIHSLENHREYVFQLVAYDRAGNASTVGGSVTGTPIETTDFWDACNKDPDAACGEPGFCAITDKRPSPLMFVIPLLAFAAIRRRGTPQ